MKIATLAITIAGLVLALPASAQRVPETPAVGTKTSSAATGFVSPNGMVNGSTSVASYETVRRPLPRYTREEYYRPRYAPDPRYAPYEKRRPTRD